MKPLFPYRDPNAIKAMKPVDVSKPSSRTVDASGYSISYPSSAAALLLSFYENMEKRGEVGKAHIVNGREYCLLPIYHVAVPRYSLVFNLRKGEDGKIHASSARVEDLGSSCYSIPVTLEQVSRTSNIVPVPIYGPLAHLDSSLGFRGSTKYDDNLDKDTTKLLEAMLHDPDAPTAIKMLCQFRLDNMKSLFTGLENGCDDPTLVSIVKDVRVTEKGKEKVTTTVSYLQVNGRIKVVDGNKISPVFRCEDPDTGEIVELWNSPEIHDYWISFYQKWLEKTYPIGLCRLTLKEAPMCKLFRPLAGSKAKLISTSEDFPNVMSIAGFGLQELSPGATKAKKREMFSKLMFSCAADVADKIMLSLNYLVQRPVMQYKTAAGGIRYLCMFSMGGLADVPMLNDLDGKMDADLQAIFSRPLDLEASPEALRAQEEEARSAIHKLLSGYYSKLDTSSPIFYMTIELFSEFSFNITGYGLWNHSNFVAKLDDWFSHGVVPIAYRKKDLPLRFQIGGKSNYFMGSPSYRNLFPAKLLEINEWKNYQVRINDQMVCAMTDGRDRIQVSSEICDILADVINRYPLKGNGDKAPGLNDPELTQHLYYAASYIMKFYGMEELYLDSKMMNLVLSAGRNLSRAQANELIDTINRNLDQATLDFLNDDHTPAEKLGYVFGRLFGVVKRLGEVYSYTNPDKSCNIYSRRVSFLCGNPLDAYKGSMGFMENMYARINKNTAQSLRNDCNKLLGMIDGNDLPLPRLDERAFLLGEAAQSAAYGSISQLLILSADQNKNNSDNDSEAE